MKAVSINALNISSLTNSHFLFTLSMIIPATKARIKPGVVAAAIILPKANSEPVSSKTSQLIAIKLNPKPISEIMLPKKNSKNVLLLNIFSMSVVPWFYFAFKG